MARMAARGRYYPSTGPSGRHSFVSFVIGQLAKTFSSVSLSSAGTADTATINVGALVHDGPATPEQISLWLPTTGSVSQLAQATCRYRLSSSGTWTTGHPLHRIQPSLSTVPADGTGPVEDGFAWVILDLQPGTEYVVEVTVTEGANSVVKTLTHSTRSLPAASGTATKTANSAASIASQLATLVPGDVLEIANGNYTVNGLVISKSGTSGQPIYIRGQSRTGVVLTDTTGPILTLAPSTFPTDPKLSNVIIENMTLVGSGVDDAADVPPGDAGASSLAINGDNSNYTFENITIRNIVATGIDRFVHFYRLANGILVYDCTATGNNQWTPSFFNTNATWNDDGIHLTGKGNCAFNNTMTGFGDTFAYASHASSDVVTNGSAWGVHYYRNEIRNSCDDPIEVDHARRNVSWYDNRVHNSVNMTSLDPLYGGPWICARNIYINLLRNRPHKWNDTNTGAFLYNNTAITGPQQDSTFPGREVAIWYQPNNGTQSHFGYRNNVHIYQQGGLLERALWLENGINGVMDWSHNSWYPDNDFYQSNGTAVVNYANLAAAQSGLPDVTPIFSGLTRRYSSDTISTINPWTTTITVGGSQTEVTATYLPTPASSTPIKNTGVAIANITDGFSGASPDRGAVISGRSAVVYGDRNNLPTALATTAATLGSNAFTAFAGQTNLTAQYGLSYEQPHPVSGILCDVTEDGATSSGHTAIDWGVKGCYDPTSKRVMWASCGAGQNFTGLKIYNTHAIYDEAANTWSANRNFQSPNEGDTNPIIHLWDGMALDIIGRRFYRKKFSEQFIMIYSLASNSWVNGIASAPGESSYARNTALEFIPTRGTQGELWQFGYDSANDTPKLWKYDVASATWTTAIASGNFGGGNLNGTFMSYNPRAFGGVGGVLVGNSGGTSLYTVRCDNLTVASCSQSPSAITQSNNMHVCRDPVGTGWLHFANNGNVYRCDGSTWTLRFAGMPGRLNGGFLNMISVPIDAYGVVWNIIEDGSGDRAWLYKP